MAGRGPLPKAQSANGHKQRLQDATTRFIVIEPAPQLPLPETMPDGKAWPERTQHWWQVWGRNPAAADFTATEWEWLLDTAIVHAHYWQGDIHLAAELRRRLRSVTPQQCP